MHTFADDSHLRFHSFVYLEYQNELTSISIYFRCKKELRMTIQFYERQKILVQCLNYSARSWRPGFYCNGCKNGNEGNLIKRNNLHKVFSF